MIASIYYVYAEGDLLDDRQTYQYSRFEGAPFLNAWRSQRDLVRAEWGESLVPPPAVCRFEPEREPVFRADIRLEGVMDGIRQGLWAIRVFAEEYKVWIKKYEVSKRLFIEYDERFRAVDKTAYRDMALYLRFAEVMEAAYRAVADVPALNVLLKVMDLLIACRAQLTDEQGQRLAWLIDAEAGHIETLSRRLGVAQCD